MAGSKGEHPEPEVKYILEFGEEAKTDLQEIYDWYEIQKYGLGDEFLISLEKSFSRIEISAEGYRKRYRNLRIEKMNRFPYLIIFKVKGKIATVVKVVHGKRHPRIWND